MAKLEHVVQISIDIGKIQGVSYELTNTLLTQREINRAVRYLTKIAQRSTEEEFFIVEAVEEAMKD